MFTLNKKPKKCFNCGCEYIQKSLNQKYCGSRKEKQGCSFTVKRQNTKIYLRENKQKMRELGKIWREKNREYINKKNRDKYIKKEKITKTDEERRLLACARNRKYYYKHRERILKESVLKFNNKIKSSKGHHLHKIMKYQIWYSLKHNKELSRLQEFIGCSLPEFRKHIESQFKEGMNWQNYGRKGWTIDHIIPFLSVDVNNENEFKKVAHYSNTQPLWEQENLRKGSKIL